MFNCTLSNRLLDDSFSQLSIFARSSEKVLEIASFFRQLEHLPQNIANVLPIRTWVLFFFSNRQPAAYIIYVENVH